MSQPRLALQKIVKNFPVRTGLGRPKELVRAVQEVSLAIAPGETLGLVGESGCGKTTVGNLIVGLLKPDSGQVLFEGRDITGLKGGEALEARRNIRMVFQDPQSSLDPRMTIKRTLTYPLAVAGLARGRDALDRARAILPVVGLSDEHLERYPHEMSGGQRQRVGIARALVTSPALIVFDEPTSALDVSVQAQVLNLIRNLQDAHGYSYLFISHDLAVVRNVSHRVAVMYLGGIVESGPREAMYRDPLHPYTQALLASVPRPDPTRRQDLAVLSGDVPSPVRVPDGCRFHPRCPKVMDCCRHDVPTLKEVAPGRIVGCHLYK